VSVPNFHHLSLAACRNLAFDIGLNVEPRGSGERVHAQSIVPGAEVKAGTTVMLKMA
jgi:hypothetical protein